MWLVLPVLPLPWHSNRCRYMYIHEHSIEVVTVPFTLLLRMDTIKPSNTIHVHVYTSSMCTCVCYMYLLLPSSLPLFHLLPHSLTSSTLPHHPPGLCSLTLLPPTTAATTPTAATPACGRGGSGGSRGDNAHVPSTRPVSSSSTSQLSTYTLSCNVWRSVL